MTTQEMWIFVKERFKSTKQALKLQAKEYKRRLKILNGEAERLRAMQATYTPREVFDDTIQNLRKDIKVLMDYKIGQDGKSNLTKYIPWIIAAMGFSVTVYVVFFKK